MRAGVLAFFITMLTVWAVADIAYRNTTEGFMTVSNGQTSARWIPTAVVLTYPTPVVTDITIKRVNRAKTNVLSSVTSLSAQSVIWYPEGRLHFEYGATLVVTSTSPVVEMELHREPAP